MSSPVACVDLFNTSDFVARSAFTNLDKNKFFLWISKVICMLILKVFNFMHGNPKRCNGCVMYEAMVLLLILAELPRRGGN